MTSYGLATIKPTLNYFTFKIQNFTFDKIKLIDKLINM